MGQEANCVAKFGKHKARGTALLETSEVIFRSEDGALRLKIAFSAIKSAKAAGDELRLETADGPAAFVLGPQAAKWCEKILHPKTRLEKLGVKANAAVSLLGHFEPDFLTELNTITRNTTLGKVNSASEWTFFAANASKELSEIPKLAKLMKGAAALWVVYPKGQKPITENDVLAAGRKAGLKDVKVVGFSPTQTALKFVIPLIRR